MQILHLLGKYNTSFNWEQGETCLKLAGKIYNKQIDTKHYANISETKAIIQARKEFGSVANAYEKAFKDAGIIVEDYKNQEIDYGDIIIMTGKLIMEGREHDCEKLGEALGFYAENNIFYTVTPYGLRPVIGYEILKVVRHPKEV